MLAGENKSCIEKFMTKSGQTIFKPALAKDIFSEKDFYKINDSKKNAVITDVIKE